MLHRYTTRKSHFKLNTSHVGGTFFQDHFFPIQVMFETKMVQIESSGSCQCLFIIKLTRGENNLLSCRLALKSSSGLLPRSGKEKTMAVTTMWMPTWPLMTELTSEPKGARSGQSSHQHCSAPPCFRGNVHSLFLQRWWCPWENHHSFLPRSQLKHGFTGKPGLLWLCFLQHSPHHPVW